MPNAYYEPEKLGLKVVAEIEYSDGCYQFDTRVVWKHVPTGNLYTARDCGCSCPTPFEDYNSLESLERFNLRELEDEIASERKDGWHSPMEGPRAYTNFLRAIRRVAKTAG